MFINNSGTWKTITSFFINVSGTWKTVTQAFINVAGTWKSFWTGGNLAPQFPVTISQSTNGTTYLITLTGTNYYWSPGPPSLTYYFEWSTNGGISWTTLSTASAVNPAFGSSTSYTHQITTNQLSPNVVNTYRFRVEATYNPLTGTSSATTTVQGPTNITLTAGTATDTTVPINWTSSTGAGRYLVEYKTNASGIWSTWAWTGTTYETITGLTQNTLYNIRVTPYTSSSNDSTYKGYTGNASNIVNVQTASAPGALTKVQNYNFTGGGSNVQGFFTTGTNTTKVNYYFYCTSIPAVSVPTYSLNTTSGTPYKVQHNLLNYFNLRTWSSTSTYFEGDYVVYNGTYYFCKSITSGNLPTNTLYWIANQVGFNMYVTPYNVDIVGSTVAASSNIIIRGDGVPTDPLIVSSNPTFSNITSTSFRTTFIPSVYTNFVDFYITKDLDYTSPTGYNPKVLAVTGATSTIHDTQTALTPSTAYTVTMYARYTYSITPYVAHDSNVSTLGYVSTTANLPDPPTGLIVTDVGTNRAYNNAAYDLAWTAPTNTGGGIIGYKIQFQVPSVSSTWFNYSTNATDTSSTSVRLTGFGSNLSTNFRVYTVSNGGTSTTAVATSSPVLGTTVPQAPTIGSATTFNTYINVTYTAPSGTGGKAISSYTATSSPGSLTGTTTATSVAVFDVVHNQPYTFTVTASNANGTSLPSSSTGTVYGVNIGSPTVTSSSSTSTTITLNFTRAPLQTSPVSNTTNTRGYYNGSLDGTTTGTSYLFSVGSPNTSASLGLAGTAVVNGITYEGPRVTNTYSTSGTLPGTPTSLAATTNRTDGVNLTFSGSTNATSYDLFWNTTSGGTPSAVSTPDFPGVSSPYLDTTISSGTTRYYWVRGKNASGTSAWYPATTGVTGTRLTAVSNATAPTSVSATGGNGSATVSWSGATNATKYRIWWSTSSTGNGVDPSTSFDAETTASPYTFSGLTNGTTYYFWVSASNTNNVWTSYSSSPRGQATPSAGVVAPSTPTGVGLTGSGSVSWTGDVTATSYEIEFYTASDANGTNAAPTTATGYTVTGISGSPYQLTSPYGGTNANWARVRVRARNSAGASAYSAWVPSATTYT